MASNTALKNRNAAIVNKFSGNQTNTGTPEVQVALFTTRINELNEHFKTHDKDYHSKRGLLALVGKRRRLLNYLKDNDQKRYIDLITKLELRK